MSRVDNHPDGCTHQLGGLSLSENTKSRTKHKVYQCTRQLSRTRRLRKRPSLNTKGSEPNCSDIRLGRIVGKYWPVIFCDTFIARKEQNVRNDFTVLAHPFVRTHVRNRSEPTVRLTVHRRPFPPQKSPPANRSSRRPIRLHSTVSDHFPNQ